jgi:hypothetical protein
MTITDVLEQAMSLSPQERKELAKLLVDTLDIIEPATQPRTGAEIVEMLQAIGPVAFVDSHIEDPVEWVKAQRRKRADTLAPHRDSDQ